MISPITGSFVRSLTPKFPRIALMNQFHHWTTSGWFRPSRFFCSAIVATAPLVLRYFASGSNAMRRPQNVRKDATIRTGIE